MKSKFRRNVTFVLAVVALSPSTGALAQWYSSVDNRPQPLYPYVAQPQPYAVEVAPNTYVIHRPGSERQGQARHKPHARRQVAAPVDKKHRSHKTDPALVEELQQRAAKNRSRTADAVVNTTQIVHEKPIVRETTRYVDDPPRVVERRHYVESPSRPARNKRVAAAEAAAGPRVINRNEKRVFSAEAEITILGPDRMSIRLFRKGGQVKGQAEALPGED
jgi:hypothetical protein